MDLEHLTKHQIVLLTLLVSFVTSIATGIVTVSLMDQAPPGVTRTINQIVERTVEKVTAPSQGAALPVATTQKTVVVKEDDLTARSISSMQKAIVRIAIKGDDQLVTRGVIIDGKGLALADRAALEASGASVFEAFLYSGERVPVRVRAPVGSATSVAILDIQVGTSTGFAPAPLVDPSKVQLGQSVIRIGGTGADTVGAGVVAMLPSGPKGNTPNLVEATVMSVTPGSVLMTVFGEVIGLATGDSSQMGADFYSIPRFSTTSATTTKPTS